ncbi:MAG: ComF family protein [Clostridia bacterium]|nr:ComF family protein [Clostridia bacterium]
MGSLLQSLLDRWEEGQKKSFERNRTCELCNREVFEDEYFCQKCREKLPWNGEYVCPVCGRKTFRGAGICLECKGSFPLYARARAPLLYQDDVMGLIHAFKQEARYLSVAFGREMIRYLPEFPRACFLVSVPMTEEKRKKRGFNQADLLATYVAEHSALPYRRELLIKVKEGEEQKGLSARQRAKNVRGLFRLTDKSACKGKGVLIVDDVMTTGATVNEIARLLIGAGATYVYVLTAACTPLKL